MSLKIIALLTLAALSSRVAIAQAWKNHHLVVGCRIFSLSGQPLKNFPGQICIYLDNGNLISATENAIRLISKDNEIIWEYPGHFHHQVNLSNDKKRILAISSDINSKNNINIREDKFLIMNLDGKVLF